MNNLDRKFTALYFDWLMDAEVQERLSNFIESLRKERHQSQRELAISLGVSYAAVQGWVRGENMPSLTSLKKISLLTGKSVDDLMNYFRGESNLKSDELDPSIAEDLLPLVNRLPKDQYVRLAQIMIEELGKSTDRD